MANRLCKDCKWQRVTWLERLLFGGRFTKCIAPQTYVRSMVDGKMKQKYSFCEVNRCLPSSGMHDCGSEGLFFQPKGVK